MGLGPLVGVGLQGAGQGGVFQPSHLREGLPWVLSHLLRGCEGTQIGSQHPALVGVGHQGVEGLVGCFFKVTFSI